MSSLSKALDDLNTVMKAPGLSESELAQILAEAKVDMPKLKEAQRLLKEIVSASGKLGQALNGVKHRSVGSSVAGNIRALARSASDNVEDALSEYHDFTAYRR